MLSLLINRANTVTMDSSARKINIGDLLSVWLKSILKLHHKHKPILKSLPRDSGAEVGHTLDTTGQIQKGEGQCYCTCTLTHGRAARNQSNHRKCTQVQGEHAGCVTQAPAHREVQSQNLPAITIKYAFHTYLGIRENDRSQWGCRTPSSLTLTLFSQENRLLLFSWYRTVSCYHCPAAALYL